MDMDDEGRPVTPHRSGRVSVVGGGSYSLALAAARLTDRQFDNYCYALTRVR